MNSAKSKFAFQLVWKGLAMQTAYILRSIADIFDNRIRNDCVDLMADVDDQRAHHFRSPEDFD